MRIDSSQRAGYFWLPNTPELKLPGTLIVSSGGKVELEVLGLFAGRNSHLIEENDISRIVGVAEKWGALTLDRCFETGRTSASGGITKTRVFVHILIAGLIYGSDEDLKFERFQFSIDGLHDWLSWTGIRASHDLEAQTSSYAYEPQEELSIELTPNMSVALGFSSTRPGGPVDGKVTLIEKAVFSLTPSMPTRLEELSKVAQQIVNFYCFAIDQTVSINTVRARSPIEQVENRSPEDTQGPWVTIVYQSLPYSERVPQHVQNTMLFRLPQIRGRVDEVFRSWISAYDVVRPALDLYFSARTGAHKYTEGRFLSLVQALETLHRRTSDETQLSTKEFESRVEHIVSACADEYTQWISSKLSYANELNLNSRVKRMLEPFSAFFGSARSRKSFARHVVGWRNYLTHYDPKNEMATCDRSELFSLCMRMEALLQLHWLKMIGFSDDEISHAVAHTVSLQSKINGRPGLTQ